MATNSSFDIRYLKEALDTVAPGTPVLRLVARFLVLRSGGEVKLQGEAGGDVKNKFFKFNGSSYSFDDSIMYSFTHGVLKQTDPSVLQAQRLLKRSPYTAKETVALVALTVASRDYTFTKTLVDLALSKKFDLFRLPYEVAKKLGTLQAGTVVPKRRSSKGGSIKRNLDLASWNVGKAACTLTKLMAQMELVSWELVPVAAVTDLCESTDAKHLLFNHMYSALDYGGCLDKGCGHPTQAKEGSNSAKFRKGLCYGKSWDEIAGDIQDELVALGHGELARKMTTAEINALTCQALRVLRNFCLPSSLSNWRDPGKKPKLKAVHSKFLKSTKRRLSRGKTWTENKQPVINKQ